MKFKVVLEPAKEGGYTIYIPALPGCISEGDTYREAVKNIKEAAQLYISCLIDDRKPQLLKKRITKVAPPARLVEVSI